MDFLTTPLGSALLSAVAGLLSAMLGGFLGGAVTLRPWRRLETDTHWTERARICCSAQAFFFSAPSLAFIFALVYCGFLHYNDDEPWSHLAALPLAAWLGAITGTLPARSRWMKRKVGLAETIQDVWTAIALRNLGTYIFVLMAAALVGHGFDTTAVIIMAVALGLVLALMLGGSLPLLRNFGILLPAGPRLETLVQEVAGRFGSRVPRAYSLRWMWANAYAFFFGFAIAVTPAAEGALTDEELRAVIAHEFGHLYETRAQRLMRLLGVPCLFLIFSTPVWTMEFGLPGLLLPMGIAFGLARVIGRFSRQMETRADSQASAEHVDPKIYASALERLCEFNLLPAVHHGKRTHPNLYDRLVAVGFTPAYPRPKPPAHAAYFAAVIVLIVSLAAAQYTVQSALDAWTPEEDAPEDAPSGDTGGAGQRTDTFFLVSQPSRPYGPIRYGDENR